MKSIFIFALLATLPLSLSRASAEENCHALKFDSYFVAQNVKDNLKRLNPEVVHPNFAGHFLVMRAELAMETIYLIASCETGEFFHDKLSGDHANYSVSSNQLDLKQNSGESTHYEWDGKSWIKGETITASNPLPAPDAKTKHEAPDQKTSSGPATLQPSLASAYETTLAQYPAEMMPADATCAPLDYSSYFRAQNNKSGIQHDYKDLKHPNFAGAKLLLKTETFFDSLYLIADCKTGKFSDETLKGNLSFSVTSRLAIIKGAKDNPELMLWTGTQWMRVPDSTHAKKETIKNTLYGAKASTLAHSVPNPKHADLLRFENLKSTPATVEIFHDLGVDTILSGQCRVAHGATPVCDVETQ